MEFLIGLLAGFAIGGLGWWVMVLIGLWIIFAWIDEGDVAVTITLIILVGVTLLAHGANPVTWLWNYWLFAIVAFTAYCGAGMAWALHKYDRWLVGRRKGDKSGYMAKPYQNKGRITNWLLYWPLSIAHDLTINLHETLYNAVEARLEAIYRRHFPSGPETK